MLAKLDLPPVWALFTAASAWVLALLIPVLRFHIPLLPWVIMAAGLALVAWSAVHFFQNQTPIEPGKTPKVLLNKGPFRINRNPVYTGMTLILIGFALNLGAVTAFFPIVTFPMLLTKRFILGEEARLRQAFGEEAKNYISTTRRW